MITRIAIALGGFIAGLLVMFLMGRSGEVASSAVKRLSREARTDFQVCARTAISRCESDVTSRDAIDKADENLCSLLGGEQARSACRADAIHSLDEGKRLGLDEGKRVGLDEGKRVGLDEGKRGAKQSRLERDPSAMLRCRCGPVLTALGPLRSGPRSALPGTWLALKATLFILQVLEARGLTISPALRERILGCSDSTILQRALVRAATADFAEAIFSA